MKIRPTNWALLVLFTGVLCAQIEKPILSFEQIFPRAKQHSMGLHRLTKVEKEELRSHVEGLLKRLASEALSSGFQSSRAGAGKRPPTGGWKSEESWSRIKDGMSERQVAAILGPPTSTRNLGVDLTLFYQGEVDGSGFVSGNVKLMDDRVWLVNKPVF